MLVAYPPKTQAEPSLSFGCIVTSQCYGRMGGSFNYNSKELSFIYLFIIRPSLLREGFELVKSKGLEVTDDVR